MNLKLISKGALMQMRRIAWIDGLKTPFVTTADIYNAPAIDAVPVVRCGECAHYKKRHVLTNDGQEKSYEEMPEEAFGGLDDLYVTMEYGINVGGKCMLDCGRGYPVDKSVFRSPNDFCSYGLKMDGDPHDSC